MALTAINLWLYPLHGKLEEWHLMSPLKLINNRASFGTRCWDASSRHQLTALLRKVGVVKELHANPWIGKLNKATRLSKWHFVVRVKRWDLAHARRILILSIGNQSNNGGWVDLSRREQSC